MEKSKKIIITLLMLLVIISSQIVLFEKSVAANTPIKLAVDGVIINMGNQPPIIQNERVLVPLRVLADVLGANTTWNDITRTITIEMDNRLIEMNLGNNYVRVDGVATYVDVAPILTNNNRIVVPLRFVSEIFGYEIAWDGRVFLVSVFTKGQSSQEITSIILQLSDKSRLQQNNLHKINMGDKYYQVEYVMGKPNRKEIGFMGLDTWTYHYNYQNFYLFGFYNGKLMYIYTNSSFEDVLGISMGDTKESLEAKVATRDLPPLEFSEGDVLVYLGNNQIRSNKIHTVSGDSVVVYYVDKHDRNTVSGIEIYHKTMMTCDDPIIDYKYTYLGDAPYLGFPQPSAMMQMEINKSLERQIFDMTNAIRVKEGLDILLWHSDAAQVAYDHSKDMSDRNYFGHKSPTGKGPGNRVVEANIVFQEVLENIAMNTINSAETIHAWMNSEGHRDAILLKENTHLGVGVFKGLNIYYTQIFLLTN